MQETNKNFKIGLIIVIVLAILGGSYYFIKIRKSTTPEQEEKIKVETKRENTIKEITDKYGALTNWGKNIYYAYQLQERVVESEKPILFIGYIDDIFKKEGKYFVDFIASDRSIDPEIHFTLECEKDKLSEIITKVNSSSEDEMFLDFLNDYAVIAKIDNVRKLKLKIEGNQDGEDVELSYSLSDTFIATGKCIDFSYIGTD